MNVEALLPAQNTFFCLSNLGSGAYPVALLNDVSEFYGAFPTSDQAFTQLSSFRKVNRTLIAYVWLSTVYGFSTDWSSEMDNGFTIALVIKPHYGITESDILAEDFETVVVIPHFSSRDRERETTPTLEDATTARSKPANGTVSEVTRPRGYDTVSGRPDSETTRKAISVNSYFKNWRFTAHGFQFILCSLRNHKVGCEQYELSADRGQSSSYPHSVDPL